MSFFVTTPIYYVNDVPHIGHAYTTIACDIINRFHKLKGEETFFLTGTDEHGQKVEKASLTQNKDTQKFVDEMSQNFRDLIPFLGCEIDDFIRTTEDRHKNAAQFLWNKLKANNQIYLSNYEGWYSIRDEAFYLESELTKNENGFVAPSGAPVEWVKEESYFFKLSAWQNKLLEFYENNKDAILPKSRYNEVLSFIKGGLKDLSISRTTFKWGIKVPEEDNHVMYVWIDALCNYITALNYPNIDNDTFKKFWPGVHIVGKDILRFHAIYWPAFLMAAHIDPPKKIFAHGWWTNEGQKISKSIGNVIDPYEIVKQYGLDQMRFFLFREVPFGNDGDFSKDAIAQRVNADLSNNFGNLIQRISSFIVKNSDSKVTKPNAFNNVDKNLLNQYDDALHNYLTNMNSYLIDKALKNIFEFLSLVNTYVDNQAPWSLKKTDPYRMKEVLYIVTILIIKSSILLLPIIPSSIKKVLGIFSLSVEEINLSKIKNFLPEIISIKKPYPIFPRIEK
jgi:methionyl-tRNA synthetase